MEKQHALDPRMLVKQASRNHGSQADRWLVSWNIRNVGQEPLQLLAGRLPHSRFRSEDQELAPMLKLLPNESTRLEFAVICNEPPSTVVENAFLILRVLWLEEPWLVFARLRVLFDEQGGPQTMTEVVTAQPVGLYR